MLKYVLILDSLHYLLKFSYSFQLSPKTCLNPQENFFLLKPSPWPLLFLFLLFKILSSYFKPFLFLIFLVFSTCYPESIKPKPIVEQTLNVLWSEKN